VSFLHQLVARAHNQLYRSRRTETGQWLHELLYVVPRRLYQDWYLRLAFVLFWGLFIGTMLIARSSPEFVINVLGEEELDKFRQMYSQKLSGRGAAGDSFMFGRYVLGNASIGLICFAFGLLFGIGGLFITVSNAVNIGTTFGYFSAQPGDMRRNFFEFVTAHGPFELTAIVLSAAAGMRMGFALIATGGLSRSEALRRAAKEAFPTACAGIFLFIGAAVIEGFISPSALPYAFKAAVAAVSSGILLFYFLILGTARDEADAGSTPSTGVPHA
jgi:uncharacterized membrane protein SpoIIM required for sporulation